jgi:hypothetical protein
MGRDGTGIDKRLSRRKFKAIGQLYRHGINEDEGFYINDKVNLSLLGLT